MQMTIYSDGKEITTVPDTIQNRHEWFYKAKLDPETKYTVQFYVPHLQQQQRKELS